MTYSKIAEDLNLYEDQNNNEDDESAANCSNEEEKSKSKSHEVKLLMRLTSEFFDIASSKNLALMNDMILIYDAVQGYFRLLDPREKSVINYGLIKRIVPKKIKKILKDEKENFKQKFYKIIYHKVISNKYLYCKKNLIPDEDQQGFILLSNGIAEEQYLFSKFTDQYKKNLSPKYCFTSYLDLSMQEILFKSEKIESSDFIKLLKELSIFNPLVLNQTRNLLLNIMTNTPKDHLLFVITSESKKVRDLYLSCVKMILSSEFYSCYSLDDLMKKNNWLSLTTKTVNFSNRVNLGKIQNKSLIENLEILSTSQETTIQKNTKTYNFKNRTILILSGTHDDIKFIDESEILKNNAEIISLPSTLSEAWSEPDVYEYLQARRSDVVLFAYYGNKYDEINEKIKSIASKENNTDLEYKPSKVDSFGEFFLNCVKITGIRNDFISKKILYQLFEKYCTKMGLQSKDYNAFCSCLKKHGKYITSVTEFENKQKETPQNSYFFEMNLTADQKNILENLKRQNSPIQIVEINSNNTLVSSMVLNGIKVDAAALYSLGNQLKSP